MTEPADHHKHEEPQFESFRELVKKRNTVFARFPLLFTLLGTFGVTATLYGLSHLLDKFPLMSHNPIIPLGVGIFVLLITGQLYKRLN